VYVSRSDGAAGLGWVKTDRLAGKIHRSRKRLAVPALLLIAAIPVQSAAQGSRDLADLSLEELGSIEVTSVSGRAERLADAPASIFVITGEDIRRSGVTSLPEALRLAPNLQVARTNANSYAISARGFNNSIGNKLLVLIDGRTVYTPLFSGVFWNAQDVMLEDIERIEVISGPGATLWGTNAVNGVINVTTRAARDTQGALVSGGAGNLERGTAVRYGGRLGDNGHFRLYGKYFDRDNTELSNGTPVRDSWDKGQVGFRADWGAGDRSFTVQGDAYQGELEQATPGKTRIDGVNLLGRWNQRLGDGSNLRLQGYYDRTERDQPGVFREDLDILDLEIRHSLKPLGRHAVIWGGGYRYARDEVTNSAALAFLPAERDLNWWNVFVQDEIALRSDLGLTLGTRLESNDYTGVEVLPSVRLAWKPAPDRLVWSAISRAVRSPSRLDRELFAPGSAPFLLKGGPNFKSEVSNVAELGYRAQASSALSYSLTAFYHKHDRLRSVEPAPGGGLVLDNKIEGSTYGVEAWGNYHVTNRWRLSGGTVLLKQDLRLKPDSMDTSGVDALGNDPTHQWMLRSAFDITPRHEFDVMVRHIGALPDPGVPAYTAVDARLAWRPRRDLELSVTLNNLLDAKHPEFGTPATRSEFERSVFLKMLWRL
jgi:iron complex outermembrane receptor protein